MQELTSAFTNEIYKDISERTNGEIYIGVVGPVRTGKSTFIKNFMEKMIIPMIKDDNDKKRAIDELPQSGNGRIIMTTEPKFVPNEAVMAQISEGINVKLRMIDCVGYVVNGSSGFTEDYKERMVKTPWFDSELPFTKAAAIGTDKVITEHSTIGVVVTTDGSFGEIERDSYIEAEKKCIDKLKEIGKPFVVVLNTIVPGAKETKALVETMMNDYQVTVLPLNCDKMCEEEMLDVLKQVLYEFPITEIDFDIPKWVTVCGSDEILQELIENAKALLGGITKLKDIVEYETIGEYQYIDSIKISRVCMHTGVIEVNIKLKEEFYYESLSKLAGERINNEYELYSTLKTLALSKERCIKLNDALTKVESVGYGFVTPSKEEIILDEPEIIKNGNKYGVKIKAKAPSIHMISANLETQIAPIVGSKEQAEDLLSYITENSKKDGGAWDTNIFGKTVEQIVDSGLNEKIQNMTLENVDKIRDTLQKVMNDNSGLVCLIV